MHFGGLHRTPEITGSTYLEKGGMIFRLALHRPTENTDDVTGQSFTMGRQLEERNCGQACCASAECDAITTSFA
jgi:hypothetical protein